MAKPASTSPPPLRLPSHRKTSTEGQEGRQCRDQQDRPDDPVPQRRRHVSLHRALRVRRASARRDATKGPPGPAGGTTPRSTRPARHARLLQRPWPAATTPTHVAPPSNPQNGRAPWPDRPPGEDAVAQAIPPRYKSGRFALRSLGVGGPPGQVAEWFKAHAWKACVV